MKSKGSAKQVEFINNVILRWEKNENCYIRMGTKGLSMLYGNYPVFWLFIDRIKIANPLEKQLRVIYDFVQEILKTQFNQTILKTEDISNIDQFISVLDEVYKKLVDTPSAQVE
jgi:hypothetical protein